MTPLSMEDTEADARGVAARGRRAARGTAISASSPPRKVDKGGGTKRGDATVATYRSRCRRARDKKEERGDGDRGFPELIPPMELFRGPR